MPSIPKMTCCSKISSGKLIVEYEQVGNIRAEYGKQLLIDLSKSLAKDIGKGFSRSNLQMMRLFYLRFELAKSPIRQTVSGKFKNTKSQTLSGKSGAVGALPGQGRKKGKNAGLTVSNQPSWSHYCELLKCNNEIETGFYLQLTIAEGWSVRELRRQMDTALFERLALSKNKKNILKLAGRGQVIESKSSGA